jgi:hypothetical protein
MLSPACGSRGRNLRPGARAHGVASGSTEPCGSGRGSARHG